MSQKTNPISLRLQKTNFSFPLSLFADYFWTDIYQTCFENKNYLAAFVKESGYSQAVFSARVFYRKFSVFIFVQDNRVSKKNALFFFKNKGSSQMRQSTTPKISPFFKGEVPLQTKKDTWSSSSSAHPYNVISLRPSERKESSFSSIDQKEKIYFQSYKKAKEKSFFSPKTIEGSIISPFEKDLSLNNTRDKQLLLKGFQHDFLRIKQGFFKENSSLFTAKVRENLFANLSFLDTTKLTAGKSSLSPPAKTFHFAFIFLNKQAIAYNYFCLRDKNRGKILPFGKGDEICHSLKSRDPTISPSQVYRSYPVLSRLVMKIFDRPCLSFCEKVMSLNKKQATANFSFKSALLFYKKENKESISSFVPYNTTSGAPYKSEICKVSPSPPANLDRMLSHENNYNSTVKRKQIFFFAGGDKDLPCRLRRTKKDFSFFPRQTTLEPIRFLNEDQNVMAVLDIIVALLEKRIAFRQIKSFLFRQLSVKPQIKGIRISCSGRLGGRSKKAQKAKVQCDSFGTTTLSTFSSKIIFGSRSAFTPYGKIGVKIWLSYEDSR